MDPKLDPMHLTQLLIDWMEANVEPVPRDEAERTLENEPEHLEPGQVAEPDDVRIDTVSAWAGTGALADPKGYVAFAKGLGMKRLDVIVNDHAKWREPRAFTTYTVDKIERLAHEVQAAGIELHFMSWLMPHHAYIEGVHDVLVPLVRRTGALSVCFDCEEPWTQARNPLPYAAAARELVSAIEDIEFGVTGIGYAPAAKLGPICAVADYLVPQCYSTSSSGLSPATVVGKFASRWRRLFPHRSLVIGLAAYRQSGIHGYTPEAAVRAAFGGAEADLEVSTVIYWSLAQIRHNREVARTIAALTRNA